MTTGRHSGPDSGADMRIDAPPAFVQVRLEAAGEHSWPDAVVGAVVGAAGGPQHRFVAVAVDPDMPDRRHAGSEHVAAGQKFPLMPFQDLSQQTEPNEWSDLARERLGELDAELLAKGWRRRPDRGRYWWSLRYEPVTDLPVVPRQG